MKYNLALKSMVDNYRELATKHNISTSSLTDEEVFKIIDNAGVAPSGEEQQEWFIEDLKLKLSIS